MAGSTAANVRLTATLTSLGLLSPGSTFDINDDRAYIETTGTILEDLDETSIDLTPETSIGEIEIAASQVLHALGHKHPPSKRLSALAALCTELQLARMHSARSSVSQSGSPGDTRIANSISRIARGLAVSVDDTRDLQGLYNLLTRCQTALEERLKITGPDVLGHALHVERLDEPRMEELQKIAAALNAEYALRRDMLLERLSVTVRAFSRSGPSFAHVLRRVVDTGSPSVCVADALSARDWILHVHPVSRSRAAGEVPAGVKDVLMGAVPDRGGRVGVAAKLNVEMPRFSSRVDAGSSAGRRRKGKGKKKKR